MARQLLALRSAAAPGRHDGRRTHSGNRAPLAGEPSRVFWHAIQHANAAIQNAEDQQSKSIGHGTTTPAGAERQPAERRWNEIQADPKASREKAARERALREKNKPSILAWNFRWSRSSSRARARSAAGRVLDRRELAAAGLARRRPSRRPCGLIHSIQSGHHEPGCSVAFFSQLVDVACRACRRSSTGTCPWLAD